MRYIPLIVLSILFAAANAVILVCNKSKKSPRPLTTPPRALLFGRIKGEEIAIEGPYEPEYLLWWERKRWERKGKKYPQVTDKKGEKTLTELLTGIKTTK